MQNEGRRPPLNIPVIRTRISYDASIYTRERIFTPRDAVNIMGRYLADKASEAAYGIICDANRRLLCVTDLGAGSLYSADISIKSLLRAAILCNGYYVTIIHNHPTLEKGSVNPRPSEEDVRFTNSAVCACTYCGLQLYDSIIAQPCTGGEFKMYSMREHTGVRKKYIPLKESDLDRFRLPVKKEEDIPWEKLPDDLPSFIEAEREDGVETIEEER